MELYKQDLETAGRTNFGITPSSEVLACLLVDDSNARLGHINDDPGV